LGLNSLNRNVSLIHIDIVRSTNWALGTVEVSGTVGATFRIGKSLSGDFGPPRLRPAVSTSEFFGTSTNSFYAFAGVHVRGVARDIFLDGNTFRDLRSVDRHWLVPEISAGQVWRTGKYRFGYTHVWRAREFHGQSEPLIFGSLNITITSQ
jgi:lipid A 3-O-deacylase